MKQPRLDAARFNSEVYRSPADDLRMKWTCLVCKQRNDNPLDQFPKLNHIFACVKCRKIITFHFECTMS
jgi:hypothetical protein